VLMGRVFNCHGVAVSRAFRPSTSAIVRQSVHERADVGGTLTRPSAASQIDDNIARLRPWLVRL